MLCMYTYSNSRFRHRHFCTDCGCYYLGGRCCSYHPRYCSSRSSIQEKEGKEGKVQGPYPNDLDETKQSSAKDLY